MLAALALILLSLVPGQGAVVAAQGDGGAQTYDIQKVTPHVFEGDVQHLPQVPSRPRIEVELNAPGNTSAKQALSGQAVTEPNLVTGPMPAPSHNFAGMSRKSTCTGGQCGAGIPPDPNGDVGLNHYIQAVNSAFAIYDKSGTLLRSFTEDSLWSGSGQGACDGNSEGDPVVLYDALADRWILTDMAFAVSGNTPLAPFYECIAVSKTGDPVNGGWYLYGVRTDLGGAGLPPVNTLNDYPKFGIWTDCLYFSANGFDAFTGGFIGGEFGSFSRSDMYAGNPLTASLGFRPFNFSNPDYFTMIPSNLSAPGAGGVPPPGTPNYYVQESLTGFSFRVRTFTPGANCGGGGTLSAATVVSQASYTLFSSGTSIIPQPSPATSINMLDSLGDRLMQKVQYRKVGSVESLWVTHTFRSSSSGPTGSQWAQINVTGGSIATTPVQQQRYNPGDGRYRWMSSLAVDKAGDMALGYSTSSSVSPNFPSIAYAGRLVSDPLNTLPQGERTLAAGNGSQVNNCGGSPCDRWGDYSSMSVDPADGCTFWYTNEYYVSQTGGSTGAWDTRIGSFSFPTCGAGSMTFYSKAGQDGWVLESGENSNTGGALNATDTTFNLGDNAGNKQYRAVLSFNTAGLPDNAVISSVTLKIKMAAVVGKNPFKTLGDILGDVQVGGFSNNAALQSADFQALSNQEAAIDIPNTPISGRYSGALSPSYFPFINLFGITQFRLRFALDDNNNHTANYLQFYSGNFTTTPGFRPKLIITYTVP